MKGSVAAPLHLCAEQGSQAWRLLEFTQGSWSILGWKDPGSQKVNMRPEPNQHDWHSWNWHLEGAQEYSSHPHSSLEKRQMLSV